MNYKVHINNSNYQEWELLTEYEMKKIIIEDNSFNPLKYKLLTGDVINDKYEIIHSPYRNDNNIPGIILLIGKTYGRTKNGKGKFLYKCIPHNKRLPAFLISYEEKKMSFTRISQINIYYLNMIIGQINTQLALSQTQLVILVVLLVFMNINYIVKIYLFQ